MLGDKMNEIVDFKKQRFIRDCKEFLKSGNITDNLRTSVVSATPGHVEYLKKNLNEDTKRLVDIVIDKIREKSRKNLTTSRTRINFLASSVLENLCTEDTKFAIPEVIKRYRESINPVKALYYDLQEIMFLYEDRPKNKHHKFLIEKFKNKQEFETILLAIDRDLEDLKECKKRINELKVEFNFSNTSEYIKKIVDLHNEMLQWKKLFHAFPEWIDDNTIEEQSTTRTGLYNTLKKFFCY